VERVREAVAARTDPNMLIIARSNAVRPYGLDDALRRGEAMHKAGADMLFIWSRSAEELRTIGERLPAPLMMFAPQDGFGGFPLTPAELAKLGYRLAASSGSALAAIVKAVRQNYQALAKGEIDPLLGKGGVAPEMKEAQRITGLDRLVEIEKRTMKD
jgi:2-methylisocitrate lyase-like PEP mutase family enzyme